MRYLFDDDDDILQTPVWSFVADTGVEDLSSRAAAWWDVDVEDDSFPFAGEKVACEAVTVPCAVEKILKSELDAEFGLVLLLSLAFGTPCSGREGSVRHVDKVIRVRPQFVIRTSMISFPFLGHGHSE